MSSKLDIIIGRLGIESLTGQVNDDKFAITTVFGTLVIPKKAIAQIHYRNPPMYQKDVIWTWIGDKYAGEINAKVVNFTDHTSGQTLSIPNDAIYSIFFMEVPDQKAPSLKSLLK